MITLDMNLYKPDRNNFLNSLEYAKKMKVKTSENLTFHCFWRVPKDFGRKQIAVLKSIIVSHSHIIDNIEINLWSNVDLSNNEYFKQVSKYVVLRRWDISNEIKGTILENSHINSDYVSDPKCYLEGDLFRLLILHKYGGFYIDMDVLVLRDMSPLNHMEFQYQWGTSGFNIYEPNITINGAIMRLNKQSNLSLEFLEKIKSTYGSKDTTSWGNSMYSKVSGILVLPGIWFNSEWGFEGTELNPFKNVENMQLFDGAYTWHWHNRWDEEIEIGSKFDILEKDINTRFSSI